MTPAEERPAIRALVAAAEHSDGIEVAALLSGVVRTADPNEHAEGLQLAADHGVGTHQLPALRSLAASRGLPLDVVVRRAFAGDLRPVVLKPPLTAA